jgi:hypothetical protein
MSWTAVSSTGLGSAHVTDVVATTAGFVAVGQVNENGHTNGGIWTTLDGTTWDQVSTAQDEAFLAVVAAGPGYVAISVKCGSAGAECIGPSSWTSNDGKTWTQHVMDTCCLVNNLTGTASTVVAVGADISTGFPQKPTDAAAFVSADGATWTRATGDQSFKQASMGTTATLGSGFVALGNGQTSMIAWDSADGKTWAQAPASEALKSGQASDTTTLANMYVVVGRDGSEAVSWTSSDGKSWTRSATSAATDNTAMNKVTAAGSNLIAVGHDSSGTGVLWSSADGLTWTRESSLPGGAADFSAVASNEKQVVVVGSTQAGAAVVLVGAL